MDNEEEKFYTTYLLFLNMLTFTVTQFLSISIVSAVNVKSPSKEKFRIRKSLSVRLKKQVFTFPIPVTLIDSVC